jgi:RNA-binding protein
LRSIAYTLFLENNRCITMTELPRTELSIALSPAERKALKARAHHLDPVVLIGDAGLTPGVMREVDLALRIHELIKVRVAGDDREARLAASAQICDQLGAAPVQQIGKLLVLYRPLPAEAAGPARPKRPRGPRKTKKQLAAAALAPAPLTTASRKRRT